MHNSVLLPSREAAISYPTGEIRLEACLACGLISNDAFDAPGHDYAVSCHESQAFSQRFQEYADGLAGELMASYALEGGTVLEIGCGDGDFLARLCAMAGCSGVGVDPSYVELESPGRDIEIAREFFTEEHVPPGASLLVCRHTLEHVHDVRGFLGTLYRGLGRAPGAAILIEVPDTMRILHETAFWDIYYEHCSYFTPGSLARSLRAVELEPTELRLGFDDQYVLVTARLGSAPSASPLSLEESVDEVVEQASRFTRELDAARCRWRKRLAEGRADGRRAVVWGAGSKGVGFLSTLGIDDEVACAVDVNPAKQGMFMPGSGHAIVAPEQLPAISPDLVVVMNPAYLAEIRRSVERLGIVTEVVAL